MLTVIIIMFTILIFSLISNKLLRDKENIKVPDSRGRYVNKIHQYGEQTLYIINLVVVTLAIMDFSHLRVFIFVGFSITFAFSMIMEWKYARENKMYLLSALNCGLFIIGSFTYIFIQR